MTLEFDPIWRMPTAIAAAVLLFALVLITYPPRIRHLSPGWRRTLLALRLLTAAVLLIATLRPQIRLESDDKEKRVVVILRDVSRSMDVRDSAGGQTRRESLDQTLQDVQPLLNELAGKLEVRSYNFAEDVSAADSPSAADNDSAGNQPEDAPETEPATNEEPAPADADENNSEDVADNSSVAGNAAALEPGSQTAIGHALQTVLRQIDRKRLAAVLLLSDGAERLLDTSRPRARQVSQTIANEADADPELAAPVRISAIAFGSTQVEGSVDIAVDELSVSPELFARTTVPVRGRLRVRGAAGRDIVLKLWMEDRTGLAPGESGPLKEISATSTTRPNQRFRPSSNNETLPFELSFMPLTPGEFKLVVRAEPLEGELKSNNNERATIVSVSKGGVKFAYLDTLGHVEQKFLRKAGASRKIEIDFFPIRPEPFGDTNSLDPQLFAARPDRYDAFLIGNVPRAVLGDVRLQELAQRVREGAGLLMLGGYDTLGAGGYRNSAIEPLLPVDLRADSAAAHFDTELPLLPTTAGKSHYIMQLTAGDDLATWQMLPPLAGANRLRAKNQAVIVIAASDSRYDSAAGGPGVPLLFSHEVGPARVMTFAGDTTWQWIFDGHEDVHQQFWMQMLLYLAHKERDSEQPVWATAQPRTAFPGQSIMLEYGARDAEGAPVVDASFQAQVRRPDGTTEALADRRVGDSRVADYSHTDLPGDYWVSVTASNNGNSLGPEAWTRFVIEPRDLELDNPAADPDLLREVATNTGGRFLRPEELEAYLQDLLQSPQLDSPQQFERIRLWDNWGFLLVFIGLMTTEWALRKRLGLV